MVQIIGLSGVARAGKDTMFAALKAVCPGAIRISVGDIIRQDCTQLILDKLGIDLSKGCTPAEKEIIRPILVGYGLSLRIATKGQYFIKQLESIIAEWEQTRDNSKQRYYVITDVRFDEYENDEVDWIQNIMGGVVVHLTRDQRGAMDILANEPVNYVMPNNESEARNDPKIKAKAKVRYLWATADNEYHYQQHAISLVELINKQSNMQLGCGNFFV